MGASNIRKLKKKYKKEAVSGIENLIDFYEERGLDSSELKSILLFCKSIKVGNFGKKVHPKIDIGEEKIVTDWRIKQDFTEFSHIYKRSKRWIEHILASKSNIRSAKIEGEEERLVESVNSQIDRINKRYKMEHRELLIDSILDD